jgi:hypothetical protein
VKIEIASVKLKTYLHYKNEVLNMPKQYIVVGPPQNPPVRDLK